MRRHRDLGNHDIHKHYRRRKKSTNELSVWEDLKSRWNADSPSFWKKILNISIAIGTSAVAVISSDQLFNLQSYGVPQIIFTIAGYIIVACAAFGLSAKITKQ